jgi:hypothetical protein
MFVVTRISLEYRSKDVPATVTNTDMTFYSNMTMIHIQKNWKASSGKKAVDTKRRVSTGSRSFTTCAMLAEP